MDKLVALCVALAACYISASMAPETQIVQDFCETILLQSQNDTTQCYDKPTSYSKDTGDKAILVYLCCLGLFQDVAHNYIPFLAEDFLDYIAAMTNDDEVIHVATFVMACKSDNHRLTYAEFSDWLKNEEAAKSLIKEN